MKDAERLKRIMDGLHCSEEEAMDVLNYDKAIDKASASERLEYDLTIDKEKEAKKFARTGTRQTKEGTAPRERKVDTTKEGIIAELAKFLTEARFTAVTVKNPSREITFTIDDTSYSVVLTRHTKKK